jgi:hypothetical protein
MAPCFAFLTHSHKIPSSNPAFDFTDSFAMFLSLRISEVFSMMPPKSRSFLAHLNTVTTP